MRVLALIRDGGLLAAGAEDGSLHLWDPATGSEVARLGGGSALLPISAPGGGGLWSLAFHPQGDRLASGSAGGRLTLWDLSTGPAAAVPLSVRDSGGGRLLTLAYHPDGSRLASGSEDGSVRLWDLSAGAREARLVARLPGHPATRLGSDLGKVLSVAFSPDGTRLAAGTAQAGVRLWDLRPLRLLNKGPSSAPRAALLAEALPRLWRLRLEGLERTPTVWTRLTLREGFYTEQEIELEVGPAAATDPTLLPTRRRFDIRPLLDPPAAGQDKLDQVLRWLAEQEPHLGL